MEHEIKIYYKDTDCGGVVYYSNYLEFFEQARTEYMNCKGVDIKELKDKGIQFIVRNARVDYLLPAVYGEILVVSTTIEKISGASLNFLYEIKEKGKGRVKVKGSTLLVCIDINLKPRRIPDSIISKLMLTYTVEK